MMKTFASSCVSALHRFIQRAPPEGCPAEPWTLHRVFRRRQWVDAATVLIITGTLMLLQPFWLVLYSYSFTVVVIGTVGYLIVSHFPE